MPLPRGLAHINKRAFNPIDARRVLEFGADGSIIRDTRYYTQKSEAPGWQAEWVEPID